MLSIAAFFWCVERRHTKWYWRPLKRAPEAPTRLGAADLELVLDEAENWAKKLRSRAYMWGNDYFFRRLEEKGSERCEKTLEEPKNTRFFRAYYLKLPFGDFELVTEAHPAWKDTPDKQWLRLVAAAKVKAATKKAAEKAKKNADAAVRKAARKRQGL